MAAPVDLCVIGDRTAGLLIAFLPRGSKAASLLAPDP
jgi:hypothetical protein